MTRSKPVAPTHSTSGGSPNWSPKPFAPAWWLAGAHLQTLAGKFLRSTSYPYFTRERIETPDGDFLDLDWTPETDPRSPLVLLLHGLEGHTRRGYVLQACHALSEQGMRVVGLNFRGCSGESNRTARSYHSGETADVGLVVTHLRERFPHRSIMAVGFSLGGNVLLKFLGERGSQGETPLSAAVAVSVPYDLSAGADALERGFMAGIYTRYFVRSLKTKVRAKEEVLANLIDLPAVWSSSTIRQFDNAATAPLHGFSDAEDYYRQSSSKRFVSAIRTPTLLVQSLDDPFRPFSAVPIKEVEANPHLTLVVTERGGHTGFIRRASRHLSPLWLEEQTAEFLGWCFRSSRATESAEAPGPARRDDEE